MCDQSQEMLGGDSGPDGEEPALTGEEGLQDRGAQSECVRGEDSGGSGGDVGQEDEEMTSGSHNLSSDNHSPGSATGSTSTKSCRGLPNLGPDNDKTTYSVNADGGKGHTHKQVMNTVAEMKKRLPSDKRSRSKASTVEALHYALKCVKQVQANSEYYKLLMRNGQNERRDATVCTPEELERVTSEHNLKNTDSFVAVFSLSSGRVLHVSEQAPSILCCKRKFLESAKFVELLFHQDVNVFYSHTAQPHLPPWTNSHTAGVLFDSAQVKSFFCRIRGGKDHQGEMRYNPFRITPYLLKVHGTGSSGKGEEPCCLALAERIISGYEAPRIPMDKRIFTTTHSPGCVFLEVDDRAVPLLGYLPQDLIGTSLLTCIHPEDCPLMLSMHRKVLKYAGQSPFEHSPVRMRCQNGDYITLDTSWSSFINPWSRKVAFIIGRHKVRTSPLNEDVFAAQIKGDVPVTHEAIKGLQAKIYKLFLQPVHNNGSSGYGSLGSNGSHEHYISVASSSDSNGNLWEDTHREPMTLQQICADVNRAKNWGKQAYFDSKKKVGHGKPAAAHLPPVFSNPEVRDPDESRKQTHIPSYQQINCVDNIIRYLDGCTGPALKRKSESRSLGTSSSSSSTSEDDKPAGTNDTTQATSDVVVLDSGVSVGPSTAAVVGAPLTDITMSTKAMSVVSVTSQCSYSSTIVHVPQPESELTALEDVPMGSEPTDHAPTPVRPAPSPAAEEPRFVGLTKEVLSAHTQKEEQEYVDRFRNRILQSPYSSYLQMDNSSMAPSHHRGEYPRPVSGGLNRSQRGKPRPKRPKPQGSSDSYASPTGPHRRVPESSWPSSESSQPQMAAPYSQASPVQAPFFPMMATQPAPAQPPRPQQLPGPSPTAMQPPDQTQFSYNFSFMQQTQNMPGMQPIQMESIQNLQNISNFPCMQPMAPVQCINPFMTPVMAVILPNHPSFTSGYPSIYPPSTVSMLHQAPITMAGFAPTAPFPQPQFQAQPVLQPQTFAGPLLGSPRPCSTGGEDEEAAGPRALFSSSRSSSPLQLNLLQEELPKLSGGQSNHAESLLEQRDNKCDVPSDSGNNDAQSTSSELLDLLLQEDAQSGTGSNASGSGSGESGGSLGSGSGSGSNGTSTSHTGSSNSSKYFASNDSSDTSRKAKKSQEAPVELQCSFDNQVENSIWSMIQHTSEGVKMTYQIHTRDQNEVLAEDREKLRVFQPLQPWFSQEQQKELADVHPWIQQHTIPQAIDTQGCMNCHTGAGVAHSPPPPDPDSSSPLEILEPDSLVDT
ncbi:period circadian protein homolog 3 isoform X1 [Nerophis lumbriciformis]|uniref:period circadian protein homolog 3 isoform X1 n=1 Tax=Nerophis lumbriciformis TaxID=546530 RepID=UPI002ADFAC78|nr:period circadian protein homolog 3-like isoform X1 [Nerophis lumbriciformis]XP_061840866.1 period circadian protein homolog 3-like isoform X1 [Nerophis lumbriciformis]XP_061840867.1 period circadian protein homolog 3-like isoform X1 [Nerophis lumbriciformis]